MALNAKASVKPLKSDLRTIFPERDPAREFEAAFGRKFRLPPIKLKEVSKIVSTVIRVGQLVNAGEKPMDILESLCPEIVDMVSGSIQGIDPDDLDLADAPFVLDAFIAQNLSEDIIKKWRALGARVGGLLPGQSEPTQPASQTAGTDSKSSS